MSTYKKLLEFPFISFASLEHYNNFQALKIKEFALTLFVDESLLSLWGMKGDVNNIANGLHINKC